MLRKWTELPEEMRTEAVKPYYKILYKRQGSIRVKRMLDLVLALCLLLVLLPVMLVIALLIKMDSRGPVFFRQERVTQYGKVYRIFKFRTMVDGADKKGPLVTTDKDSRITKVGEKLRDLRLDELPQLLNVLAGDMSFVGTRPEVKKYVDRYTPKMRATLLLPAGITSKTSIAYKDEAEVIAEYQEKYPDKPTDDIYVEHVLPEKMKYNLKYLQKFNVFTDLRIMAETVLAVLK